jgi:predicted butyrate kinase (DUF1464 family)
MPRVIGIDPGTVSIDVCGLDDGRVFLDRTLPSGEALADPSAFVAMLESAAPVDLVAGPSGYGLPLTDARDVTDDDLRLAYLAPAGEQGGIRGLRALMRAMAASSLRVVLTPGVIHLRSVPEHRKVNRVDMGTADKVCAVALAIQQQSAAARCAPGDVSFILLELGGAFTAALAVLNGRIVDGVGGSAGPMGMRAAGALDGEVAFLAGTVSKRLLFRGGAIDVAGIEADVADRLSSPTTAREQLAWDAYVEGAVKAMMTLTVATAGVRDVVLSGRLARVAASREVFVRRLTALIPDARVHVLEGFAKVAKQAAQGAALIADGLAGGPSSALIHTLGIRDAAGTCLDHLVVISRADARARLGLAPA